MLRLFDVSYFDGVCLPNFLLLNKSKCHYLAYFNLHWTCVVILHKYIYNVVVTVISQIHSIALGEAEWTLEIPMLIANMRQWLMMVNGLLVVDTSLIDVLLVHQASASSMYSFDTVDGAPLASRKVTVGGSVVGSGTKFLLLVSAETQSRHLHLSSSVLSVSRMKAASVQNGRCEI